MFAVKARTEFIPRVILIAVILFNALAPSVASASSLSDGKQNEELASNSSGEMPGLPSTDAGQSGASVDSTAANDPNQADALTPIVSAALAYKSVEDLYQQWQTWTITDVVYNPGINQLYSPPVP